MRYPNFIEQLENRIFMSGTTQVTNVVADNRGLVNVYFNGPLFAASVNTSSVTVLVAGPDGQLNTGDDVATPATVAYGAGQDRIVINANLPVNTAYWVLVRGNAVTDANGQLIDGEYTGALPSGNGTAGGNFAFDANVVPVNQQIAAFNIQNQRVNVRLYSNAQLPLTIPDFLNYVNSGSYDGTFIHRINDSQGLQIVQGGAFYVQSNPVLNERPTNPPIAEEPVFSNTTGTIALANTGAPGSSANQWYFNVGNDSDLDGHYSVFGAVTNNAGLSALQTVVSIPSAQQMNLSTTINNQGQSVYGPANVVAQLTNVPTFKTGKMPGTVNPQTDFIIVSRVAIRNQVTPIPGAPGPTPSLAVGSAMFADGTLIGTSTAIAPVATPDNCLLKLASDKLKL